MGESALSMVRKDVRDLVGSEDPRQELRRGAAAAVESSK
jgi:hypothetical protein